MTGVYTGRSPKDKYIVMDENSKDTVWWTTPMNIRTITIRQARSTWAAVKEIARKELCNKKLYVVDAFCGANKDTRMAVRFIVEVAWQAHFIRNMFIKPTAEELRRTSSRISLFTTLPSQRLRTTRNWAFVLRPPLSSTSPAVSRLSSTPGTAAK
jgi:ATP-dependent phosphoenolpyruvate carboxykinase